MAKVKVTETKTESREIDMEYRIYLYFQDELCNDELVMVKEDFKITVKWDIMSLAIEKSKGSFLPPHYIKNNLTTEEHFMEAYNEALSSIEKDIKH
jgi:hypothetical protein